jgi:SET domain-containing protein
MLKCRDVYVASAGKKGRGVFARKKIKKGQTIESAPYIEIPPKDDKKLSGTIIESYWFEVKGKWSALGLGFTSLYNHSEKPNATFYINQKSRTIRIQSTRPIAKDEEILINYGYEI